MISVVIPVYNAESTIMNIAKSLCNQGFRDFEALLIDDGSTDRSYDICAQIAANDPRFRYIHQKNAGVSAARNRGLQEASGDYITFLDADDAIDPNYLQVLVDTCISASADISVCDVVVETDGVETLKFTLPCRSLSQSECLNELLTRRTLNSGPYAKLFRRSVLEGLSFPPLKAYEDILFVKNAFSKANRVAATNETAYHYIQNPLGAMSSFSKAPSLDIVKATDELLDFIAKRQDLAPDCFYITASHLMQYVVPMLPEPRKQGFPFIFATQKLYHKYAAGILRCSAFPWKEKIVYLAFSLGWIYHNRRMKRLKVVSL